MQEPSQTSQTNDPDSTSIPESLSALPLDWPLVAVWKRGLVHVPGWVVDLLTDTKHLRRLRYRGAKAAYDYLCDVHGIRDRGLVVWAGTVEDIVTHLAFSQNDPRALKAVCGSFYESPKG